VRRRAAEALGEIRGEGAVAALIEAFKDEDKYVRSYAAYSLDQLDVDLLASGLKLAMLRRGSFARRKAVEVIGYYSDARCEEELRPLEEELIRLAENEPDHEVRQIADNALSRLRFKGRLFQPDGNA